MRKQIEIVQKKEIYYCDICGKPLSKHRKCKMCGRDVCSDCSVLFDWDILEEDHFIGDYPDIMCKECWQKGKPFREEIKKIRKQCEEKEYEIVQRWEDTVKNPA